MDFQVIYLLKYNKKMIQNNEIKQNMEIYYWLLLENIFDLLHLLH